MNKYSHKKIAVLGLSLEGVDATKFLVNEGADVTCCDMRTERELGTNYEILSQLPVAFQLGKNYLKNLINFALVVRTPGMDIHTPQLIAARGVGVEITSLTKLFFDEAVCPIIGVTGTKGKGTTSTLIYEILKQAGKKVYLGGNVGIPLLSLVRTLTPQTYVVYELSSFQLEDLHKSPFVAVVLKIAEDHLANYDPRATNFHRDRQSYVSAKKTIVKFQSPSDLAILNADDVTSSSFAHETKARVHFFGKTKKNTDVFVEDNSVWLKQNHQTVRVVSGSEIKLRGAHNLENIAAATLVTSLLGLNITQIQTTIKTFAGLKHRLQLVATNHGVSYYDDSFSTTPETAIAALNSFSEPIILIAGGSEKGADFGELGKSIVGSSVKTLILIGQMTTRINTAVEAALAKHKRPISIITGLKNMESIVSAAKNAAISGDVVLLSPACASFDMFKNYKERGNLFKKYAQTTP